MFFLLGLNFQVFLCQHFHHVTDGDQICSITSLKAGASGCTSAIFYTQCKVAAFLKHRDIDTPGEKVSRKSLALRRKSETNKK